MTRTRTSRSRFARWPRDLVRTLNGAMTSDITVYLRGGTYPLAHGHVLQRGLGSGGFYVKYLAYPGSDRCHRRPADHRVEAVRRDQEHY
jgi:hypothetical protein